MQNYGTSLIVEDTAAHAHCTELTNLVTLFQTWQYLDVVLSAVSFINVFELALSSPYIDDQPGEQTSAGQFHIRIHCIPRGQLKCHQQLRLLIYLDVFKKKGRGTGEQSYRRYIKIAFQERYAYALYTAKGSVACARARHMISEHSIEDSSPSSCVALLYRSLCASLWLALIDKSLPNQPTTVPLNRRERRNATNYRISHCFWNECKYIFAEKKRYNAISVHSFIAVPFVGGTKQLGNHQFWSINSIRSKFHLLE